MVLIVYQTSHLYHLIFIDRTPPLVQSINQSSLYSMH